MQKTKRYQVIRYVVYILGLSVMSFGIAMATQAGIGVAPGSAVAYAVSQLTILSFGWCTTFFHIFCMLLQFPLTKRLTLKLALQLPLALAFGRMIDLFRFLMPFHPNGLISAIMILCGGVLIFSLGIRTVTGAELLLMPADSLALTAGAHFGWQFPKSKLAFDFTFTTAAAALMLVFSGNVFSVIGIGTIICAAATGPAIALYTKLFPFLDITKTRAASAALPGFEDTEES